ncbi:GNAT family N-acetyltransferase [Cupriavidus agavae]|uniref:Acetyltransferase (GNAT) family protein n=1 Tax=Cupriavidus agavae TaxID=1001822 RepID=A0A4Q7S810_9BURK|nr:GNAT family N-acetyltransferase [Cupriavidus agavae]RZT41542.1 acetyltransferase (GNAT) family protein [Cupriavidus agavae]
MTLAIRGFDPAMASVWDAFCSASINGTFLHSRHFLSYHGSRFQDASVLIEESGDLVGIFPAAVAPSDAGLIVSHPGATFGGIVHHGRLAGAKMIDAIEALNQHYASQGYERLLYKAIPHIHARAPAQDDLYALYRVGAERVRCDLSCTIDLAGRRPPSERRRRSLKKASRVTTISPNGDLVDALWRVLEGNLERKHDARPVHSLAEIRLLQARFPDEIQVRCGIVDNEVEAGVVLFNSNRAWHAQYIASSARGYESSVLDAVFDSIISEASASGARYFDFGTSNEEGGRVLNDGLYRFKHEFGGGGVAHEFYQINLTQ